MKLPEPATLPQPKPPNPCSTSGSPCNSKMSDDLDDLQDKIQFVDIQVKVFKECKDGKPTFETQTITTLAGLVAQEQLKFGRIAEIEGLQCQSNCIATVPEWWQVRLEGHRPQVIFVFAEKKEDGTLGNDYYSITIPHPKSDKPPEESPLQPYKKGSW
jgi:hypothetical protein